MSIKGYESTPMTDASSPTYAGDDRYQAPGSKAKAEKAAWKQTPTPAAGLESEDD